MISTDDIRDSKFELAELYVFQFTAAFKKYLKLTPLQWRFISSGDSVCTDLIR